MKRRPWPIIILAWFHFLAPIGNFFFNAALVPVDLGTYFLAHFDPVNLPKTILFLVIPPLAGLAIYACKKWSLWVYILLMLFILFYSYTGWKSHPEMGGSLWPLILLFIVNILLVGYFLIPAVRQIYLDPRLRWWENKPRYAVDFEALVKHIEKTGPGKIMNLSEGGVFVQMQSPPADGEIIEVTFDDRGMKYTVTGTAIHHRNQKTLGIGVQFEHSADSAKALKALTKKLQGEGKMIPAHRLGPEDSFSFWAKKALKTGDGLVPKINKK